MLRTTDKLVRQHMTYLLSFEDVAAELSKFDSLYHHILYYSTSVLQMDIDEAVFAINDFLSNRNFIESLEGNPLNYMIQ
jgi:hypothetical protein